jgi:hypothetical protein
MTAEEFREAVKIIGFPTQRDVADYLGVSIRKVNGMANGEPIPVAIQKLLRLLVRKVSNNEWRIPDDQKQGASERSAFSWPPKH